jgi:hypothetical protein
MRARAPARLATSGDLTSGGKGSRWWLLTPHLAVVVTGRGNDMAADLCVD